VAFRRWVRPLRRASLGGHISAALSQVLPPRSQFVTLPLVGLLLRPEERLTIAVSKDVN